MNKSNTQKREGTAVVADLIVPGTTSIVRIFVLSEGNHLTSVTVGIGPGSASIAITIII
jgi:hypothetical protein